MPPRMALFAAAFVVGCATADQPMRLMTEQETSECEAQGGTIEPAYALNEYVCLLPAEPPH
jgi:hypothetical protein